MDSIINSDLPKFKVNAFHDGRFITITDDDLRGRWSILFFYPADFCYVCPTELVDIAEKYDRLQELDVEVYAISTDSHFAHKTWHHISESIRKVKFPMLSDITGELSRAFRVMIDEEGMSYRGTFIINPQGKVMVGEVHDKSIGRNADELLRKVEAAIYVSQHPGAACPARWQSGDEVMKPSIDLIGKI